MNLKTLLGPLLGCLLAGSLAAPAVADPAPHLDPTAVFSGLDKITGRIISFEVATNETVQFGSLQITEKACYTRPATEGAADDHLRPGRRNRRQEQYKRIFSGLDVRLEPGLNGIEHPVYDVWLTDCKGGKEVQKTPETASVEPSTDDNAATKDAATKDAATKDDAAKGDAAKDDQAVKPDDSQKAADQAPKPERRHRVAGAARRSPTTRAA